MPSNGGTGIKLKTPKETLTTIIVKSACARGFVIDPVWFNKTKKPIAHSARAKFVNTPAEATNVSPNLPLTLCTLYGTGFAQPKNTPAVINAIKGTIIEPIISMCGIGLRVNLPAR